MIAYLKLWLDWGEKTKRLQDDEKGRLIDAMVACASGKDPEPYLKGNEAFLFPVFEYAIKREQDDYQANSEKWRENGKKGGRPKKTESKQEEPKATKENQKNQFGFSETKKSQDKDKDKDKEEDINISDFEKAVLDFKQHRKALKAPLSDIGEKKMRNELQRLAGNDESLKIRIIDQSIRNGWKGVFPLTEDRARGKPRIDYQQREVHENDLDHLLVNLDED